jgi:enamine deaminase RidA (YjgF/YER057c/UK114 family)
MKGMIAMAKKTSVTLENYPAPFLGSHAVGANGYCFCPVVVAPFGSENRAGVPGDSMLAQFPRGAAAFEAKTVLDVAEQGLNALGSSLALGTKIEQFVSHSAVAAPYLEVRSKRIETETRPASTNVQVAGLVNPNAFIGIQLIAYTGKATKEAIVVPGMPASPGKPFKPAPHAVVHGDFVFVTGQVSFDFDQGYPAAANIDETSWYQSKATAEGRYILAKHARILEHLGGSLKDCVRLEIYLNDMEDVVDLEKVMHSSFGDELPARTYMPTVRLGPTYCRVEITAICRRPGSRGKIIRIDDHASRSGSWLSPVAVEYGGFVFTSSLCGNLPNRLDASVPLGDQVSRLFDKMQGLGPLNKSGLDNVLFAGLQIANGVNLGELRWNVEQVKGQADVAISPVVVQAPLLWVRGGIQADFICAVN